MADDGKKVEEVTARHTTSHYEAPKSQETQSTASARAPEKDDGAHKAAPQDEKAKGPLDRFDRKERPHEDRAPRKDHASNLDSFRKGFMGAFQGPGEEGRAAGEAAQEGDRNKESLTNEKTDKRAEELQKQGVPVNRENLKNEVAFQEKLEKRNEAFQKDAKGDVMALGDLGEKLNDQNLPARERDKLQKEYDQKKGDLDTLQKAYDKDIQNERLDVKVEPYGANPTNGQKQNNGSLENILVNQGYTREQIYKDKGALLNRVAQENNLSNPGELREGMTLKVPIAEAKLNSMTEAKEKEGIVTKKDDGSEVRELMDGTTITKKPDGSTVKEYEKDGAKITETTQEKDGAKIDQVVTKNDDGSSKTVTKTEKNGIVEKTIADTKISDKNIEDLISKEDRESLEQTADAEHNICGAAQERNKAEITTTTKTITDTTKEPPEEKTVLESTQYKQTNKLGEQSWPPTGMTEVDSNNSGKTFSVTETKVFDKNGKAQTIKDIGTEQVIKGKGGGQEVNITRDDAVVFKDGKKTQELESTEYKGFDRDTVAGLSGVASKDDFNERLQGGAVPYKDTTIKTFEDGKDPKTERLQQVGNYENPGQDGRTMSRIEKDGKVFWNYTKVEEDGKHTQSETVIEGTKAKILTDSRKNDDGTFKSETKSYDGDNLMEQTITERRPVNAADVRGDDKYKEEFLEANKDKQLFEERSYHLKWDTNEDGERTDLNTTDVRAYSSKDGADKLTSVSATSKDGPQKTSILQDERSDTPARVKNEGDGSEYTINKKGDVTINGKHIDLSSMTDTAPNPDENTAKSGTDALKNLYDSVKKYDDQLSKTGNTIADLPASLKGTLGGLGVAMGSFNLYNSIKDGKPAEAIASTGDIASGLSALAPIAEDALTSAALKSAVGVGGRVLGGVGAAIGIGYGAYEVSQGKTVDGILDMGAGAGVGAALIGIAAGSSVVPVAGWAVAGVCIAAKIGYDIYNYFDSKSKTEKLEI
jgi:hypothetical protein